MTSFNEPVFWLGLTVGGTALWILFERHIKSKVALVAITICGALIVAYSMSLLKPPNGIPVWVYLLLLTWGMIAWDIFDRERYKRRAPVIPPSNLVIHSALYGDGSILDIDVKDKLKQLNHDALAVHVSNGTFGRDPVPNVPKTLRVKYSYGSPHQFEASRPENALLLLPEDQWLRQRSDQFISILRERDDAYQRMGGLAAQTNQANARAVAAQNEKTEVESQLSIYKADNENLYRQGSSLLESVAEKDKLLKSQKVEIESLEAMRRSFGGFRLLWCGSNLEKVNWSVAVLFIDHHDAELAKSLRGLFENIHEPWWDLQPVQNIGWKENPTGSERIVLFSDKDRAQGVAAAINECRLLANECVHVFPRGDEEVNYQADFTFVIFPKPASGIAKS